ncbi:anthranilate synthase component II [Desulfosarcina ovata]|uniref:Glutamine amidotransferase n=2 Tax=Desulfosarcina ovata TaxID=83564 RepID=A0A5K8AK23_9BACT|nr:aminodeoxychorismate/anthranilate synthase component II [Desulfosarcina ovata]BBO85258.1 glutamine amidotransferase [Desulfosarcina ovata subsp. sediminis]BBO92150.1 glutamine amidotransferase [Desulfosarcina ovata subsp. ovata]
MILMIDNYDSFTYNLVQYLKQIGEGVVVKRNDTIGVDEIAAMAPQAIVISPGPGRPESAGVSLDAIVRFSGTIPILGVCLGHQSIAHAFGGKVISAMRLMHGKTSMVTGDGQGIFRGIKTPFQAMRYHSLAVEKVSLPDCLTVSATADDGEIMGLRHREHLTEGIQFHPESIMTPLGKRLLRNFLKMIPASNN